MSFRIRTGLSTRKPVEKQIMCGCDRDQGIIGPKEPLANETLKSPREYIVHTRRKKMTN